MVGRPGLVAARSATGPEPGTRMTTRLLPVPLLSPILHYTGVTYDESGRVVDVTRIHYRGDRFSFTVTLDAE
ncbi:UTRA domain-containing protein [Streptomyces sp. NPDC005322]|uniref:UTRA domain-containing protein n=1 Tax=Streptomyces sp. NPDC005322 TaxID=3157032 RepID=UPI0033AA6EB8